MFLKDYLMAETSETSRILIGYKQWEYEEINKMSNFRKMQYIDLWARANITSYNANSLFRPSVTLYENQIDSEDYFDETEDVVESIQSSTGSSMMYQMNKEIEEQTRQVSNEEDENDYIFEEF